MRHHNRLLKVLLAHTFALTAVSALAEPLLPVPAVTLRATQVARDVPLDQSRRILVGPDGNYYVLDAGNNRLVVLSSDWKFVRQISAAGQEPGALFDPQDFALDRQGNIFVIDGKKRLQGFTPDGRHLGTINYQAECLALAVNARGEYLLSQPELGALVTVYGPHGGVLRSFGKLNNGEGRYRNVANRVHLVVTSQDEVYVSLDHQGVLQKYDATGRLLWETAIPGEEVERLRGIFWSDDPNKSKHGVVITTVHSRVPAFYVAFNLFFDESRRQLYVPLNDGSIYVADAGGKPLKFMKQPRGTVDFYSSVATDRQNRLVATSRYRGILLITPARPA
ncbi:MAG: 6-bladed beta-propeller [Pyrinomonadaceae bacterium]